MQNLTENSMMMWSGNAGGYVGDNIGSGIGDYWNVPQVHDYYQYHWYPQYYPTIVYEQSKVDKAFKILQKLQEKGVINVTKVKTFIELVDEITKVI